MIRGSLRDQTQVLSMVMHYMHLLYSIFIIIWQSDHHFRVNAQSVSGHSMIRQQGAEYCEHKANFIPQ